MSSKPHRALGHDGITAELIRAWLILGIILILAWPVACARVAQTCKDNRNTNASKKRDPNKAIVYEGTLLLAFLDNALSRFWWVGLYGSWVFASYSLSMDSDRIAGEPTASAFCNASLSLAGVRYQEKKKRACTRATFISHNALTASPADAPGVPCDAEAYPRRLPTFCGTLRDYSLSSSFRKRAWPLVHGCLWRPQRRRPRTYFGNHLHGLYDAGSFSSSICHPYYLRSW